MQAIIALSCIGGYLFAAGLTGRLVWHRCRRTMDATDAGFTSTFSGIFWPISAPIWTALLLAECIASRPPRPSRQKRKADREALEHQRRLEIIREERLTYEAAKRVVSE